eukprot:3454906-Amphidinium_carterae.1
MARVTCPATRNRTRDHLKSATESYSQMLCHLSYSRNACSMIMMVPMQQKLDELRIYPEKKPPWPGLPRDRRKY